MTQDRFRTEQEAFWAGDFGADYIGRNEGDRLLASNLDFFARALRGAWPGGRYLAAVPLKDALVFALWLRAWWKRDVMWRGHAYRIGPGSRLSPAAAPHPAVWGPVPGICDAQVSSMSEPRPAFVSRVQHDAPETAA